MSRTSPIAKITAESFEQRVLRSELPVLVAFCADSSAASQKLLALLEAWIPPASGLMSVVRVNVAEAPELVRRSGVPSAPGLALFSRGVVCYQFSGELSRRELDDLASQAHLLAPAVPHPKHSLLNLPEKHQPT